MNSASGKSPSGWRVAVIAGAGALFASAMTPANAAAMPGKPPATAKKKSVDARQLQPAGRSGGNMSPLSLQWMLGASLRP